MLSYILCMGNQIAGRDISQKRKKHIKSRVVVPLDVGRWLAAVLVSWSTAEANLVAGGRTDVVDAGPDCAQHNQHAGTPCCTLSCII